MKNIKEQLIEILTNHFGWQRKSSIKKATDEILKMAEFESLCNPDVFEARMNEHFEQSLYPGGFVRWYGVLCRERYKQHVDVEPPSNSELSDVLDKLLKCWKTLQE